MAIAKKKFELAISAEQALKRHQGQALRLVLGESEAIELPQAVAPLLIDILHEMAIGNEIKLVSSQADLTTQQAANVLSVSRPFLIGLLEAGVIAHYKVGTHRRLKLSDIQAYLAKLESNRVEAMKELADQSQDLGLGY
jgi:excisionase family DNA binding protein